MNNRTITDDPGNVTDDPGNVTDEDPGNVTVRFKCYKCARSFKRKDNMRKHENVCDGLDKRQCKMCLKMFATRQSKFEHVKYVKCNPPFQNMTTTNNNNSNHNITNNNQQYNNITTTIITNNNNQQYITNNNNNIRLVFGNENVKQLWKEEDYTSKMEEYVKCLKYAIPNALTYVYFNDKYPENQTLKKDRKNDNFVRVHVGEGKWENRIAIDIVPNVVSSVHKCMDKYVQTEKLNSLAKNRLKAFGKEMSKVKDWSTESIEDRLEIKPFDDPDDEEMKRSEKIMCKLIQETVYEESVR